LETWCRCGHTEARSNQSELAHPVTSHIEPLAAQARPVRTREHRIKHDTRMLDRPQRPVGAMNVLILAAYSRAVVRADPIAFVRCSCRSSGSSSATAEAVRHHTLCPRAHCRAGPPGRNRALCVAVRLRAPQFGQLHYGKLGERRHQYCTVCTRWRDDVQRVQ
jgi:hypothetical protein